MFEYKTTPTTKEFAVMAIERYGENAQLDMVTEEASELIQAVCKRKRGRDNRDNIIDEIADNDIMREQLKYIALISDTEIEQRKKLKIKKLMARWDAE